MDSLNNNLDIEQVKQHPRENDVPFLHLLEALEQEEEKYKHPPYLPGSVVEHIGYTDHYGVTPETRRSNRTVCVIM